MKEKEKIQTTKPHSNLKRQVYFQVYVFYALLE